MEVFLISLESVIGWFLFTEPCEVGSKESVVNSGVPKEEKLGPHFLVGCVASLLMAPVAVSRGPGTGEMSVEQSALLLVGGTRMKAFLVGQVNTEDGSCTCAVVLVPLPQGLAQ